MFFGFLPDTHKHVRTCFARLDLHILAEASAARRRPGSDLEDVLSAGLQPGDPGAGISGLQSGVTVRFMVL